MPKYRRKTTIIDAQIMTSVTNFGATLGTLNTGDALFRGADGSFHTLGCVAFNCVFEIMATNNDALTGTDFGA